MSLYVSINEKKNAVAVLQAIEYNPRVSKLQISREIWH